MDRREFLQMLAAALAAPVIAPAAVELVSKIAPAIAKVEGFYDLPYWYRLTGDGDGFTFDDDFLIEQIGLAACFVVSRSSVQTAHVALDINGRPIFSVPAWQCPWYLAQSIKEPFQTGEAIHVEPPILAAAGTSIRFTVTDQNGELDRHTYLQLTGCKRFKGEKRR